jgi:hypothetical protein
MITTKSVFICDRDGRQSAEVRAPDNMPSVMQPPEGWMRIVWDCVPAGETKLVSNKGYMCPACSAAFKEFVGLSESNLFP